MECTYCKDNHCGFKEIINCKHKELMDENANLERRLQEELEHSIKLRETIKKFREMVKPILEVGDNGDFSNTPAAYSVQAVIDAQKFYKEHELFED